MDVAAVAERGDELCRPRPSSFDRQGIWRSSGVLADPEIQVVHNCTPNHLHFAINKEILAAKKHVISEKPLAMMSAESRRVGAAGEGGGRGACGGFQLPLYAVGTAGARCADRRATWGESTPCTGRICKTGCCLRRLELAVGAGVERESRAVADVGSHWCDLVQFITGLKIVRVMADLVTIHPVRKRPKVEVETYAGKVLRPEDLEDVKINTEDYGSILLEFDSGAHGSSTVNQCAAGRKNRLYFEIDGEKCAIAWNQERPNELWIGRRDGPNQTVLKDPSLLYPAVPSTPTIRAGTTKAIRMVRKICSAMYMVLSRASAREATSRRLSMGTMRSRFAMRC